jgi:hypothetical protein
MTLEIEKDKPDKLKKLLHEPFLYKSTMNNKNISSQKIYFNNIKLSYQMKIVSRFTFDFVIEQKLSN